MFPGAPAACLKWLDLNEPATLDRAATAGYCKDAVFGRLTGVRATDPSDASMPFGDGTGMGYSDRVLELTGLTDRRSLLAPIVAPVPVAELHDAGAALLGLPAGTPHFAATVPAHRRRPAVPARSRYVSSPDSAAGRC